jgi:ubiquinone/menaquinone biosynthesis C-methylase UbiE
MSDSCPVADTAALYDRVAGSYERWWAPVIRAAALRLLDLIELCVAQRPNALVLDLGAGTGPLARAAAARWPRVRVLALDPSQGMLDLGRAKAEETLTRRAARRVTWMAGAAERLPIADETVDAVVSSFSLQYFRRKAVALREVHRVCRPGAAIALVTWLQNGWPFVPWQVLDELLDELAIVRSQSTSEHLFRSLPSAAAMVRRAGFGGVRATAGLVDYQWELDALVHCAVEAERRQLFESLDAGTAERLLRLWRTRVEQLAGADLRYRGRVAYVSGRRR